MIIKEVLENLLIYQFKIFFPIAKLLILFLLFGILFYKNSFIKLFSILISTLLFVVLIFQNIGLNTSFGYAIILGNVLLQTVVLVSWIYEFKKRENDFSKPQIRWWNIMIFVLVFFAFWMPASNGKIDFSLKYILMNEAGLTYCMITPVILSFMLLYYPNINKVTLRLTSFIGLLFGIMNILTWFVINTAYWWMGVVHLPLFIISLIGLVLSKKI